MVSRMTLRMRTLVPVFLGLLAVAAAPLSVSAQTEGHAEINYPAPGQAVSGLVTITGTAAHPWFANYDLTFAYASNPTGTWFPLSDPVDTPVFDGRLALWDTTNITDGEYALRLRVFLQDGTILTTLVEGVRVRNRMPIETPTPTPVTTSAAPTATPPPPTPVPARPTIPPRPARMHVEDAAATGMLASFGGLGLLAMYTGIRSAARANWRPSATRRTLRKASRRVRRR
jgi:hypothetical protein